MLCVIEPAAALQLDQLIRFKIGAEMECRLLPGARMQRLSVDQQTIEIKQAGLGWAGELIQRSPLWLALPRIKDSARMGLRSASSPDMSAP